jgi:hypothetical protein
MQLHDENYHDTEAEFQELRNLLIESYALTGCPDNSIFLQIHPQYRWIEDALLAWAETTWASGKECSALYLRPRHAAPAASVAARLC